MTDEKLHFHVIISTADGTVYDRDLRARTAVMAVCSVAVEIDPQSLITNVHARLNR